MPNKIDPADIVGKVVGNLTVIAFLRSEPYINQKSGRPYRMDYLYECRCICGNLCVAKRALLVTNHVKSCGCLKPENRLRSKHPSWKGHGDISLTMWKYIRGLADKRGIPFEISIEDAWAKFEQQGGKCALSGVPISFAHSTSSISPNTTASLDRIVNANGYAPDNVQWLHKNINRMKWDYGQEEFIHWCHSVSLYARTRS
jgi:hypothetical protein